MGKRLKIQRRGKGTPKYRSTIHAKVDVRYLPDNKLINGQIVDMITDPVRSAPLAKIILEDGRIVYNICASGLITGQKIQIGSGATQGTGNILPLSEIDTGKQVYNIEKNYGDGGKFVRSAGQSATIVAKKEDVTIKLPSGELRSFPLNVRATIGVIASSGKQNKPYVKAGNKYKAMKAKGKPYPIVRGVAMNAVDHPFGGYQHHVGHSKSTSRHAPPGRKVGAIASSRTGRRKKN